MRRDHHCYAVLELAREALDRGIPVRLRVYGRSMRPTLEDGDRLEVRPLAGLLAPGEVIACVVGERLLVHRIARVERDGSVVTRGDAFLATDPPHAPGSILGRVFRPGGRELPRRPLLRMFVRRALTRLSRTRCRLGG